VHFEILANDVEKLKKFYSELFGWKIEKVPDPIDYWTIENVPLGEKEMLVRPGVNGEMMKREASDQKPANYIAVESVDEYMKKIKTLNRKILVPKMEVPGIGW